MQPATLPKYSITPMSQFNMPPTDTSPDESPHMADSTLFLNNTFCVPFAKKFWKFREKYWFVKMFHGRACLYIVQKKASP